MNPFNLNPMELIKEWGTMRDSLPDLSDEYEQLEQVAIWWAQCPFGNWSMYPDKPESWISPWEMFYENCYCQNSIALGMIHTLNMGGWDSSRIKLQMIRNIADNEEKFIIVVDDKHVLNYLYREVADIDDISNLYVVKYSIVIDNDNFKLIS